MTLFRRLSKQKEKRIGLTITLDPATSEQLRKAIDDLNKSLDKWELKGDRNLVKKYNGIFSSLGKKG